MPYQRINDLDVFYEEFGYGEPILFLHSGYSRGILAFSGQIQPFYSAGFRCLYPDFRGHGRTKCKDMRWDSALLAEDMICFLDSLKIDKVNLIGYSTGGGVAYYMASKYPERINRIISIGNGGVIDSDGTEDFMPEALLKQGAHDFIENVKCLHAEAHGGDWQEYLRQEVKDWKVHPCMGDEEWARITIPMLLIAGENDYYATKERLEKIKSKCPQAEIFIVKNCGHGPHFPNEEGKMVNDKMLAFLKNEKK